MSIKRSVRQGLLVSSSLVVALGAVPSAANADDSPADQGTKLEEITVTARRREEKLQEVPIAVTVVSQEALQDNNVQSVGICNIWSRR